MSVIPLLLCFVTDLRNEMHFAFYNIHKKKKINNRIASLKLFQSFKNCVHLKIYRYWEKALLVFLLLRAKLKYNESVEEYY